MLKSPDKQHIPPSNDVLQKNLWTVFGRPPEPTLTRQNTALLCIDLQFVDAHPDFGLGLKARKAGLHGFLDYYWDELSQRVLPNVIRLQELARSRNVEVIHAHVAGLTADGRDSTRRYRSMGLKIPRDTKEAQFLPEVAPVGDELVFSKLTSSVFNSTTIERVLRNMGIQNLIFAGVVTNGCVESSARSAAELDFGTIVVSDATAAMAPQLHEHSLLSMSYKDAVIKTTEEVAAALEGL